MGECRRMNVLLGVINKPLSDLEKGLAGTLNMTQAIEDLIAALTISEWPGRNPYSQCAWEKFSWPSKKSLLPQYADMIKRHGQLTSWTETLATPISVWLSGLFNPMAYLTSILQVTARPTRRSRKMVLSSTAYLLKELGGPSGMKWKNRTSSAAPRSVGSYWSLD